MAATVPQIFYRPSVKSQKAARMTTPEGFRICSDRNTKTAPGRHSRLSGVTHYKRRRARQFGLNTSTNSPPRPSHSPRPRLSSPCVLNRLVPTSAPLFPRRPLHHNPQASNSSRHLSGFATTSNLCINFLITRSNIGLYPQSLIAGSVSAPAT